MKRIDK